MGKTHWSIRALSLTLAICLLLGIVPPGTFTLPVFAAADSTVTTTGTNVNTVKTYAQSLLSGNYANAGKTSGGSSANRIFTWDSEGKEDAWRYYNGVMLDAFIQLGVSTGDTTDYNNALTFLDAYMDANIAENGVIAEYALHEVDSVPPALALMYLIGSAAHREKYEKAATIVFNELEKQYTYSDCGGNYLHKQSGYNTGVGASGWEVWNIGLDGLYMAEPFLMAYANALDNGNITNNSASSAEIYEEVYDRFIWVANHMYDEATGLYHHGWSVSGGTHKETSGTYTVSANSGNGHFWGRGIGWYAVGLVEVIDRMPDAAYKAGLIEALKKLFDGMLKYQDSGTGMWYNVVNRDDSLSNNKLETSVTSLMAYALLKAYNEGWVKENDYAVAGLNAFNGLVSNKYKDGKFTDIYLRSGVGMTDEYYCGTYAVDEAKGVGAILMAAAQANETAAKLHNASSVAAEQVTIGMVVTPQPMVIAQGSVLDTAGITATVVTNQGTVKTVPGSALTYAYTNTTSDTTSEEQENITVTAYYNGVAIDKFSAKVVNTANTETGTVMLPIPGAAPADGISTDTEKVFVGTNGSQKTCVLSSNKTGDLSEYVTISGGASYTQAEDGDCKVVYGGTTYQCVLKIGSSVSVEIDTSELGIGNLIFAFCDGGCGHSQHGGEAVSLAAASGIEGNTDANLGQAVGLAADGTATYTGLMPGKYTLTRKGGRVSLGLIIFEPTSGGTGYDVTLSGNSTGAALCVGGEAYLSATLSAALNGANADVTGNVVWASSEESVATVENGKVKALKAGETTVTATVTKVNVAGEEKAVNLQLSVPVKVYSDTAVEVMLSASPAVGGVQTEGSGVTYCWIDVDVAVNSENINDNLSDSDISYSITGGASLHNNNRWGTNVTLDNLEAGVYTVYATLQEVPYDGSTYTLSEPITIGIPVVISGETAVNYTVAAVDAEAYSIQVGDKTNVSAIVTDGTQAVTTGYTLSWISSDTSIATVNSSGVVTGLKAGTVTITATVSGSGVATYSLDATPAAVEIEVTEAATNWVNCNGAFTKDSAGNLAVSEGYEITNAIQSWTFTSVTNSNAADTWDTPVIFIQGGAQADNKAWGSDENTTADLAIRSDKHAWNELGVTVAPESSEGAADTGTWLNANKAGVTVKVTAQIVGTKIVVSMSNNDVTSVFVVDNPAEEGEAPYLYFTGEGCVLNNLQTTEDHLDIAAAVTSIAGIDGNLGEYVLNTTGIIPGEKYVIAAKNSDGSYTVLGQDHYPAEGAQDWYYALVPGSSTDNGQTLLVNWETGESFELTFDLDEGAVLNGSATEVSIAGGNMYPSGTNENGQYYVNGWILEQFKVWIVESDYRLYGYNNGGRPSPSATYTVRNADGEMMLAAGGTYYFTIQIFSDDDTNATAMQYDIMAGDTVIAQDVAIPLEHNSQWNTYKTHAFTLSEATSVSIKFHGITTEEKSIHLDNLKLYQLDSGSKIYDKYNIWVKESIDGTVFYVQGDGDSWQYDQRFTYVAPINLANGTYHVLVRNSDTSTETKYGSLTLQSNGWHSTADASLEDTISAVTAEGADADDGVLYIYKKQLLSNAVKFQVSPASAVLEKAGVTTTFTPTVLVDDAGASSYKISWTSSDTGIATVNENGVVTAVAPGEAVITATLTQANGKNVFDADENPGISQSMTVTVDSVYELNITSPIPEEGKDAAIINLVEKSWMATEVYKDGEKVTDWTNISVQWESSNNNVVTLDDKGEIIKHSTGTATITGKLYVDGVLKDTASVTVTVMAPVITVDDQVLHLGETGRVLTPTVTFNGAVVDADSYTIAYELVDGTSVTVNSASGALTTNSVGDSIVRATITAWKTYPVTSGPADTAIVEVITTTGHEWNTDTVTIFKGETLDLSGLELTIHWSDGPAQVINGSKLTVSGWDTNNANAPGTYSVTVSYTVGSATFTKQINVVVQGAVTDIKWFENTHDAYSRIDTVEPNTPYVFGRVNENGNMVFSNVADKVTVNEASYTGITPLYANWVEDPSGADNRYFNLGTAVQFWYFEEVDNESGRYYVYFLNEENEKEYLWVRSNYLGFEGMEDMPSNKASRMQVIINPGDGGFQIQNASTSKGFSYRGTFGLFTLGSGSGDWFYIYGEEGTITTYVGLYGNKTYTYVGGASTAEKILRQIQEDYTVFEAEDDQGTNEKHLQWNNSRVSWVWMDEEKNELENVDPDTSGVYYLHVFVDGVDISGSGIQVTVTGSIDHWALSDDDITVPLNGQVDFSKLEAYAYSAAEESDSTRLLTLKGGQIEFDFAGATLDGKPAAVNTSNKGAVYTVPVQYNGEPVYKDAAKTTPLTLTVRISEDPYFDRETATEYAGYPAEGSVKFDKNVSTDGTFYNQTGVAQLELTAAGVTASSAVDVVLIVDISNSMAWTDQWFVMPSSEDAYPQDFKDYLAVYRQHVNKTTAVSEVWEDWTNGVDVTYETQVEENGETVTRKETHSGATDYVKIAVDGNGVPNVDTKLDQAMESAAAFADILLGSNSGNTLSFVTFAGMDHQHNTARNTIDSVHSVFTGVSDAAKAKVSFVGTRFYKLTTNGTSVQYELTLMDADGHILASGVNRGNTNYDFAFGQAYETVLALKAQIAAQYEAESYEATGRQLHVVFMTDGAPSHYNGNYYGSSSTDYQWGTTTTYTGNSSLTDVIWLNEYISSYNTLATKLVEEGGLDGFHAVGFDMAHGGFSEHVWQKDDLLGVISGLIRNQVVNVEDATSGEELIRYYKELASALTYSGTDAKVTDIIGSDFTLYTGTENTETVYGDAVKQPPSDMWIKAYRLVTVADVGRQLWVEGASGAVTVTAADVGKRVMLDANTYDYEALEHLVFNFTASGPDSNGMTVRTLESYTTTNLKTNETKTVTYTGKGNIDGYFFNYVIDSAGHETITWELGDITDRELALSYYVYLKGSMDGAEDCPGGTYETNETATLEYVDNQGRHAARKYEVPSLPWQEASVTVRFFLVNDKGEYVNFAGTAFESEALRVFLAEYYVYSGLELSGVNNFTSEQVYADAKVTKYPLYDKAVALTVYRNPSSNGNALGSGYTVVNQDGKKNSQELIRFVDTYGDGSYVKTVIEIPVVLTEDLGESLQRLEPVMVVVDYGKPIDIDVISDQEATYYETGFRAQDIKDKEYYWYQMEIIGFATYSELHDQKDYVREDSISDTLVTEYGQYTLVKDEHAGFQVRFTPSRFFEEPENVFVGIKFAKYQCVDKGNGEYEKGSPTNDYFCMYKQLSVVPATVMYYETDFAENVFILHQGEQIQGMKYTANLMYTPAEWYWSSGVTATITGPGTYTMTWEPGKQINDCYVFYIEIPGAGEDMKDYKVTSMTVKADSTEYSVDTSQLRYDIGTDYRVTICNAYVIVDSNGNHLNAMGNAPSFGNKLVVTFTLSDSQSGAAAQAEGDTTEQSLDWTEKTDSEVGLNGVDVNEKPGNAANSDWDHIQNDGPVGSGKGAAGDFSPVYAYGYDSTYSEDNYLSDGDSWFVKGASTAEEIRNNAPSTYATFTFTGTGFDLISRTGREQATLRIHVTNKATGVKKIISVIDKGANELYQIPVISVKDLEHGTYDVQIIVYESFTAENLPEELREQMARGNEFYFDAIRIYDPVKPETVITKDADGADITVGQVYSEDGENAPQIIQIGKLLMDLKTYESLGGAAGNGAVYMDGLTLTDSDWKDTDLVQDYQSVGPNNEVYLKKDQGIAFILNIGSTIPTSIQIGAKSIQGTAPTLNVEIRSAGPSKATPNAQFTKEITTSSAMYYKVAYGAGLKTLFGNNQQVYVIIWNTSEAILSVTDIKIAYAVTDPDVPASVSVDRTLVENAGSAMLKEGYQLKKIDDAWYYCDGEGNIQSDYTGLVETLDAGTWYVNSGKVDFTYNGMYEDTAASKLYYIRGGMVDATLDGIASRNGQWMYFTNGVVDTTFTGIVSYGSTGQWYVENGIVRMDFSGTVTVDSGTYTIQNGKVVS